MMRVFVIGIFLLQWLSECGCLLSVEGNTVTVGVDTEPGTDLYTLNNPNYKLISKSDYISLDETRGVLVLKQSLEKFPEDRISITLVSFLSVELVLSFLIVRDVRTEASEEQTVPSITQQVRLEAPGDILNGTPSTFVCRAEGFKDKPVFSWSPDPRQNRRISVVEAYDDPTWSSALTFKPILRRDGEQVNCTVRGDNIEIWRIVTFTIRLREKIKVVAYLIPAIVQNGGEVTLYCNQTAGGPIQMRMYRVTGNRTLITESSDVVSWLSAKLTVTEHSVFECEGYDGTDSDTSVTRVYVKDTTTTSSTTTTSPSTTIPVQLFLRYPDYIEEGKDVNFTCEVRGIETKPQFSWSPSVDSDRIQATQFSSESSWISTLQFKPILQTDGGNVTCEAKFPVGEQLFNITKYVSFEVNSQVKVVVTPESVAVLVGDQFTLTCSSQPARNVRMMWYIAGDVDVLLRDSAVPVAQFSYIGSVKSNVTYVCEAEDRGRSVRSNAATVYIIPTVDSSTTSSTTTTSTTVPSTTTSTAPTTTTSPIAITTITSTREPTTTKSTTTRPTTPVTTIPTTITSETVPTTTTSETVLTTTSETVLTTTSETVLTNTSETVPTTTTPETVLKTTSETVPSTTSETVLTTTSETVATTIPSETVAPTTTSETVPTTTTSETVPTTTTSETVPTTITSDTVATTTTSETVPTTITSTQEQTTTAFTTQPTTITSETVPTTTTSETVPTTTTSETVQTTTSSETVQTTTSSETVQTTTTSETVSTTAASEIVPTTITSTTTRTTSAFTPQLTTITSETVPTTTTSETVPTATKSETIPTSISETVPTTTKSTILITTTTSASVPTGTTPETVLTTKPFLTSEITTPTAIKTSHSSSTFSTTSTDNITSGTTELSNNHSSMTSTISSTTTIRTTYTPSTEMNVDDTTTRQTSSSSVSIATQDATTNPSSIQPLNQTKASAESSSSSIASTNTSTTKYTSASPNAESTAFSSTIESKTDGATSATTPTTTSEDPLSTTTPSTIASTDKITNASSATYSSPETTHSESEETTASATVTTTTETKASATENTIPSTDTKTTTATAESTSSAIKRTTFEDVTTTANRDTTISSIDDVTTTASKTDESTSTTSIFSSTSIPSSTSREDGTTTKLSTAATTEGATTETSPTATGETATVADANITSTEFISTPTSDTTPFSSPTPPSVPTDTSSAISPATSVTFDVTPSTGPTSVSTASETDTSTKASTTPDTTSKGVISCPEITDDNGEVWNNTEAGVSIVHPCPNSLQGKATRICLDSGDWGIVRFDDVCRTSSLNATAEKISQIQKGTYDGSVAEVFQELYNAVDPESMTPSDMDKILNMVDSMTEHLTKTEIKSADIKGLMNLSENMLKVDSENWGAKRPKNLLTNIDRIAKGAITGEKRFEQTYFTETIYFEIGSAKEKNIECPDLTGDIPEWVKSMNTSTRVTKESFPDMSGNERLWYSGVIYRTVEALLEKQYLSEIRFGAPSEIRSDMVESSEALNKMAVKDIVSGVMSFNSAPNIERLNPPLYVTFQIKRQNDVPICSFIDYNETTGFVGNWSTEGCWMESRDGSKVVCACNHTTNFAILMNPFTTEETEHDHILGIISIVGCGISLLFLLTTVIVYCMVWRHMVKTHVARVKAILLMNLCVTLIISYTLFLAGVGLTQDRYVCTAVAALLHYFFLAVFCVMLAEGIHLFISIVIVINFTSYLKSLFILIWVTPALIVGITIGIVKIDGYIGQRYCWLSTESNVIWAFVAPALFIILVNTIILLVALRRMMVRRDDKVLKQGKYLARALCVILPIIGITWLFGVFAVNRDLIAFQYLFAICNSLQGAFVFIFHCCTSNVRAAFRDMRNRFNRQSISKSTLKSGSVYRTKSSQDSYHSVTSNNSNYHLSLRSKARHSSGPFEQQGNEIGRFIALPGLFDNDFKGPNQILFKEGNLTVNRSPTSLQEFNLGFTDPIRRRVAFSGEYPGDHTFSECKETNIDPQTARRRSISFIPMNETPETELEGHLRRRRRELQLYEVSNVFSEIRRKQEQNRARERWQEAYDAIGQARKFKLSPQSSSTQETSSTTVDDSDRYIMMRL